MLTRSATPRSQFPETTSSGPARVRRGIGLHPESFGVSAASEESATVQAPGATMDSANATTCKHRVRFRSSSVARRPSTGRGSCKRPESVPSRSAFPSSTPASARGKPPRKVPHRRRGYIRGENRPRRCRPSAWTPGLRRGEPSTGRGRPHRRPPRPASLSSGRSCRRCPSYGHRRLTGRPFLLTARTSARLTRRSNIHAGRSRRSLPFSSPVGFGPRTRKARGAASGGCPDGREW